MFFIDNGEVNLILAHVKTHSELTREAEGGDSVGKRIFSMEECFHICVYIRLEIKCSNYFP